LQDAVRGEFREVAKLLSDNGGKVFEEGSLVDLKDSKLAGMFGHVPQQMFDFDPEWYAVIQFVCYGMLLVCLPVMSQSPMLCLHVCLLVQGD
jgi:hypothetical protein